MRPYEKQKGGKAKTTKVELKWMRRRRGGGGNTRGAEGEYDSKFQPRERGVSE
jgi:hypothetical protein